MPQNPLLIRFVAVLTGLVFLAAMPRQADATDDPHNVSFEERWQTVPRNDEFICGGFKPEVRDSSLEKNETSSDSKPLPRGLGKQLRDVQNELLSRDTAKARKKRGTAESGFSAGSGTEERVLVLATLPVFSVDLSFSPDEEILVVHNLPEGTVA